MTNEDAATLDRRTLLRAGAGATAAAVGGAAATGSAAAQTQEIIVGPEGDMFTFSPSSVTIAPGTTVTFTWETDGHNVSPTSVPDGASWGGHPEVVGTGTTYEFTFETLGTYEYQCDPHAPGMAGSIEVVEGGPSSGPVNTGPPKISSAAMSLTTGLLGVFGAILASIFFFTKYGGSDDEE
ncbi:cupredoxin domain-containing protein [Salinarchaeum laminariae]|uniref:cupredoxin domain-containing protein n=1 Tax=Salinarchaeum laminariae TaxID=869888 RepID=UPI0020BF7ACA|nr:plastocyanin/azurin family copper-binding protein [Salinarchaeum laminariae]